MGEENLVAWDIRVIGRSGGDARDGELCEVLLLRRKGVVDCWASGGRLARESLVIFEPLASVSSGSLRL